MNTIAIDLKTVFSGVQPTGTLHLGNYLGALSVWAANQRAYHNLFCVVDLHALTIPEAIRAQVLRRKVREVAALYIASGIDPEQSIIFRQSDVPAHAYLAWILECCTPVGWLERMTQYKVKAAKTETVSSGLLEYPVLQAADILLYHTDYVPVGDDQAQHIEITRDIAQRFNHLFGEYFKLPEAHIRQHGARIMGLDDPTTKMSKSVAETHPGHAVGLLDSPEAIRKTVTSAVTDSGSTVSFENGSPGIRNLLVIYEVLSGEPRPAIEARFAGKGYGTLKREVADRIIATLQPVQQTYQQIMNDPGYIDELLAAGAARASAIAEQTLTEVRQLVGV